MSLEKDLKELEEAQIISPEIALKIQDYYQQKKDSRPNRLVVVFGILGATLVGLGITLVVAHNWDDLSRFQKTIFAFLPLLIGQGVGVYTLLKKADNLAWREGIAAFIILALGANISLISQIYHLSGTLSEFLWIWMLLSFPLMYVLNSSSASLLYWLGITYYGMQAGYYQYPRELAYGYWILVLLALPYYYLLYRQKPRGNFMTFHNWIIPLSLTICLGTIAQEAPEFLWVAYMSLFGLFYHVAKTDFFWEQSPRNHGYLALGGLGSIIILLFLSFDFFWEYWREEYRYNPLMWKSPEIYVAIGLSLGVLGLFILRRFKKGLRDFQAQEGLALLFVLIFFTGLYANTMVVWINLLLLAIGIWTIVQGVKQNHLGVLNYGILILGALVMCRFFDQDISFVVRGLMFIGVGLGFFVGNYLMLQNRKRNAV